MLVVVNEFIDYSTYFTNIKVIQNENKAKNESLDNNIGWKSLNKVFQMFSSFFYYKALKTRKTAYKVFTPAFGCASTQTPVEIHNSQVKNS